MLQVIKDWISGALTVLGAFLSGLLTGQLKEQKEQAENVAKQSKADAQAYANRPRTVDEYERRLLDAAERKDRS